MKQTKRILILLFVLIFSVAFAFGEGAYEKLNTVKIVYTNDTHCGYKTNVGFSGLAAYVKNLKANYPFVTLVDAGDAVQGEAIGTVSEGEYLVDLMNKVGYEYGTFGNHEFDYNMNQTGLLVKFNRMQYLACNITYTGKKINQLPSVKPYEIISYGTHKVALIGVATPESYTKSTPKYFMEDNEFVYVIPSGEALYKKVQETVNEVRAKGVDMVIVLSHLGVEEESNPNRATDLIANTTGIDAVIDGHSHTVAPMEIYKNKAGKDVVYTQTGTKFKYIGTMTIDFAKKTIKTELVQPKEKDPEMEAFIKKIDGEYEKLVLTPVAEAQILLSTSREDGTRAVRNRETAIGDLCADAYRIIGDADIGFSNGGGIRKDIKKGYVTLQDIINVFPFGNKLVVIEATGRQILDALEWGAKGTQKVASENGKAVGESGGFLQVSGLRYTIDTSIPSSCVADDKGMFVSVNGERRVKDVEVGSNEEGWKRLNTKEKYTLACHDYKIKNCGDGFTMFLGDKIIADETMIDNQVLSTYIQYYLGGVIGNEYAEPQGRIIIK